LKQGDNARSSKRQAIAKAIARKGLTVSSALVENPDLTDNQKAYVENRAYGMNKQDAARGAGYSDAAKEALRLEQLPTITEALQAERSANARLSGFTRQDVLDGIKEAINDAKILADPQAQIAGWREIAKICGHYAPEVKQHVLTSGQQAVRGNMELLSDEDLLRIVEQRNSIPGESKRLPDDQAH
jgi:phage terminase small subunit